MYCFPLIECISGMYDKECNLKCSQFCQKKSCHQTSGECVYGCEDGYIGGLCTIRKIPAVIKKKNYEHHINVKDDINALYPFSNSMDVLFGFI